MQHKPDHPVKFLLFGMAALLMGGLILWQLGNYSGLMTNRLFLGVYTLIVCAVSIINFIKGIYASWKISQHNTKILWEVLNIIGVIFVIVIGFSAIVFVLAFNFNL